MSKFPNHKNNINLYFPLDEYSIDTRDKILKWCRMNCKNDYRLLLASLYIDDGMTGQLYKCLEFWFESKEDKMLFTLVLK